MEKQQIIDTVNEFLMEEFEADAADIVAGENMHEALGLDSLVEHFVELEQYTHLINVCF